MYGLNLQGEIALLEAHMAPINYPPALLCARLIKKAAGHLVNFSHYADAPNFFDNSLLGRESATAFLQQQGLYARPVYRGFDLAADFARLGHLCWLQRRSGPERFKNTVLFATRFPTPRYAANTLLEFCPAQPRGLIHYRMRGARQLICLRQFAPIFQGHQVLPINAMFAAPFVQPVLSESDANY